MTDLLQSAAADVQRQTNRAIGLAVADWARQCGMTPMQWLEYYAPRTSLEPGDGATLRIVVTAHARDEPLVL